MLHALIIAGGNSATKNDRAVFEKLLVFTNNGLRLADASDTIGSFVETNGEAVAVKIVPAIGSVEIKVESKNGSKD